MLGKGKLITFFSIYILIITLLFPRTSKGENKNKCYLGMSLPGDFRPFSNNSPWNTPIPPNPKIDPMSEKIIKNLYNHCKKLKVNFVKWTIPLFVINSKNCPKVNVLTIRSCLYHTVDHDGNRIAEGIPMPKEAWPQPEEDGHMILIDPFIKRSWEFSKAKKLPNGEWTASVIDTWDLSGPGYRKPFSGKCWWMSGARGSGTPLIAGLIRPEEIEAGRINHALGVSTPINRKTSYPGGEKELCIPASRTDGWGIGTQYIPEGARLQLNPALNLDKLGLSKEAKVIARALQKYGAIVADNATDFKLYFQNLGPDRGKWKNLLPGLEDISKIPILEFRVLKCEIIRKQ